MAAASVFIPLSTINQNGGVLPPSALVQHTPRHGRSRAASTKGKGGRTYSVVEDHDVTVAKAVAFVLKRSVPESEASEDDEEAGHLHSDSEGWVSLAQVLEHSKMIELAATLEDIQRIVSTSNKSRFTLRQFPGTAATEVAAYQVRLISKRNAVSAPIVLVGEPFTTATEDLPEFIFYETSYQGYPLILTSGGIKRAGGSTYLSFSPVIPGGRASDADVNIWIKLRSALEAAPDVKWQWTESGSIVTSAEEVPKALWKKAVARRSDVGLLFEDGEVRQEVPEALRKGAKGKGKKGKESLQTRGEDESGSASASDE